MPMRDDWVSAIFDRLLMAYGARFATQYNGQDAERVRAFWAQELDGITSGGVAHALANLPHEHPPTPMAFRALCNARPLPTVKALPRPAVKADPERVRAALAAAQRKHRGPMAWAYALKARHEAGEALKPIQLQMMRRAFGVGRPEASIGAGRSPIDDPVPQTEPQENTP
jgi:hypothetical protein